MFAGNIPGVTQTVPTAIYMAIDSGNMTLAWLWVITIIALSFLLLLFTRTKETNRRWCSWNSAIQDKRCVRL